MSSGPDLIEQVLVTDAKNYIKHFGARAFKPVLGNEPLQARAGFGLNSASSFNPPCVKTRVQSYAPVMAELTKQMLNSWSAGKSVQIDFEFETLTSKIALKTLFDLDDLGDREPLSIIEAYLGTHWTLFVSLWQRRRIGSEIAST